jgi:diguanylate cyclase (GGDEF)-like protein
MDEVVLVDVPHWSATGDGLAFFGELFVVYAATRWIISSYKLSMTDKLTSLYNRHYLERAFEKATLFRRAQDTHGIHLIILDIDDFKKINDHFGHLIGDNVLVALSELLKNNTRPKDIVARQGGEEFEILLPESDRITALKIAERIRAAIEDYDDSRHPKFTASLGVSEYMKSDTIKSLRQRADIAVYEAKANGKNQVIFGNVSMEAAAPKERHA